MSTQTITTRIRKGVFKVIIGAALLLVKGGERVAGNDFAAWSKKRKRAESYDPKKS
jgi:hypothetical protein